MDAIQAMLTRKSVRKFTQDPVKEEDLRTLLDCGRMAPSGVNRQAWRFIVLRAQEMKEKVADGIYAHAHKGIGALDSHAVKRAYGRIYQLKIAFLIP